MSTNTNRIPAHGQTDAIPCAVGHGQSTEGLEIMLGDDEALEGVEAWLSQQEQAIRMRPRDSEFEADIFFESPAGWLLRLVRHARTALATC